MITLPTKEEMQNASDAELEKIGLFVTDFIIAAKLDTETNEPYATTSINLLGEAYYAMPTEVTDIRRTLKSF